MGLAPFISRSPFNRVTHCACACAGIKSVSADAFADLQCTSHPPLAHCISIEYALKADGLSCLAFASRLAFVCVSICTNCTYICTYCT